MDDVKQAEQKAVETETTQVVPPATEELTTEVQTTLETPVEGEKVESQTEFPVGSENWTAEQRRAFQEQRQEIKRLREEVGSRKQSESAFNAFRAPTPPVMQPGDIRAENFIDPNTGMLDTAGFDRAINAKLQAAQQAANYTAQQTAQDMLDENNARIKHPELFSDRDTEQEIADRWFAAKMRGENPSILEIADRVSRRYGSAVSKAEKIGKEQAFTEISEKEKAGLSASGQTSAPGRQEASSEELANLSFKTRKGDYDAVASRISKIPWANK